MSLAPGLVRTTSSRLLTRANEPELKSQSESAYRVVKQRKVGAPDTIRTCDLCLRRASPPTSVVIVPLQDPQQPDQALSPSRELWQSTCSGWRSRHLLAGRLLPSLVRE